MEGNPATRPETRRTDLVPGPSWAMIVSWLPKRPCSASRATVFAHGAGHGTTGGLWDDIACLAVRARGVTDERDRRLYWHHLVMAVGNFKRQANRRLRPSPLSLTTSYESSARANWFHAHGLAEPVHPRRTSILAAARTVAQTLGDSHDDDFPSRSLARKPPHPRLAGTRSGRWSRRLDRCQQRSSPRRWQRTKQTAAGYLYVRQGPDPADGNVERGPPAFDDRRAGPYPRGAGVRGQRGTSMARS
jgi:hypothetical protein